MILDQLRSSVDALAPEEREQLTSLAITLDPERDDVAALKRMTKRRMASEDRFHFLTGDTKEVNRVLDRLGIERRRDPESGVIDHANLFLLVDRQGRLAYRFTLGNQQKEWLIEAIRLLIREEP